MKKNRKSTRAAAERLPRGAKTARDSMLRVLAGRAAHISPKYLGTLPRSVRKAFAQGAK